MGGGGGGGGGGKERKVEFEMEFDSLSLCLEYLRVLTHVILIFSDLKMYVWHTLLSPSL